MRSGKSRILLDKTGDAIDFFGINDFTCCAFNSLGAASGLVDDLVQYAKELEQNQSSSEKEEAHESTLEDSK